MSQSARLFILSLAVAGSAFVTPVLAKDEEGAETIDDSMTIVVTAPRIKGSVDTDLPLDMVLDEGAIASYGASSLTDLLSALGTQTQSTRTRGQGGPPIVLLNGRRVSGFQEMRDLPPEAITRVEILPEDVAIRYGYAPGQRVVNFILKDNFSSVSGEVEYGGPTAGGQNTVELNSSFLRISKKGRVNLSANFERATKLEEGERDLIPTGADRSGRRTLLPRSQDLQLNSVVSRALNERINATFNAKYDIADTKGALGIPLSLIANSAATPFDLLDRDGQTRALRLGVTIDQGSGLWRWTVTGSHDRNRSLTLTDRNSADPALLGRLPRDVARSLYTSTNLAGTVDGSPFRLPAGPARLNLKAGFENLGFNSFASNALGTVTGKLSRREWEGRASLDLPILDSRDGLGRTLGSFSVNGNYAHSSLSDFGGLDSYGYGFVWSPFGGVTLYGSVTAAQAAPSPQQLGDPFVATPNVSVYDYAKASTVLATLISGGNAGLLAEEQRDKSLTLSLSPKQVKNLGITATYTAKRSTNLLAGFPSLNFETERAFGSRVTRDAAGNLVSIDQRPVNYLASRDDTVRWGLTYFEEKGRPGGPMGMGGGPRGPRPAGSGGGTGAPPGPRPGGSQGGGRGPGGGGFGGPPGGSRWSVSFYHTLKLNDDIAIAPGLPLLDRLNGGATGFTGGTSRHKLDLEGALFKNGLGFRAIATWRSATRVDGGTTAPDLFYGDIGTLNLRFFVNFDQRKSLIKDIPFLKGGRMSLRIDNLFNTIQKVRDQSGATPLRYQPGYLDPLGRTIEISFRKLF